MDHSGNARLNSELDPDAFKNMTLEDQDLDDDGGVPLPHSVPFDKRCITALKPSKKPSELEHHTETIAEKKEEPIENPDRSYNLSPQLLASRAPEFGYLRAESPEVLRMPYVDSVFQAYRSSRSRASQQPIQQTKKNEVSPSTETPHLPIQQAQEEEISPFIEISHLPIQRTQKDRVSPSIETPHLPTQQAQVDEVLTSIETPHLPIQQVQEDEVSPSSETPHLPTTVKEYDILQPASRRSTPSRYVKASSLPPKKWGGLSLEFSPISLSAPQPTHGYVVQAFLKAEKLPKPQSFLIILDLNGTLLERIRDASGTTMAFRPFLENFLQYCLGNHNVLVWSSATPKSVKNMCSRIFSPSQRKQLLGEWGRDTLNLTESEYNGKTQVYKRLDQVWKDKKLQSLHPNAENLGRWSQSNTVLIDDSILKAQGQPFNYIEIPEFTQSPHQYDGTDVLSQVVAYLEELRKWDDVSRFIHSNPFRVDQGWVWDWKSDEATGLSG